MVATKARVPHPGAAHAGQRLLQWTVAALGRRGTVNPARRALPKRAPKRARRRLFARKRLPCPAKARPAVTRAVINVGARRPLAFLFGSARSPTTRLAAAAEEVEVPERGLRHRLSLRL